MRLKVGVSLCGCAEVFHYRVHGHTQDNLHPPSAAHGAGCLLLSSASADCTHLLLLLLLLLLFVVLSLQIKLDMEVAGTMLLRSMVDESVWVLQTDRVEQVGGSRKLYYSI